MTRGLRPAKVANCSTEARPAGILPGAAKPQTNGPRTVSGRSAADGTSTIEPSTALSLPSTVAANWCSPLTFLVVGRSSRWVHFPRRGAADASPPLCCSACLPLRRRGHGIK